MAARHGRILNPYSLVSYVSLNQPGPSGLVRAEYGSGFSSTQIGLTTGKTLGNCGNAVKQEYEGCDSNDPGAIHLIS